MSGPLTGHGFLFSIARQRYVPSRVSLVRLQPEALYTSLSMGDCDVQGMLHLRLPAPGLLRLPVRRVQESQGQAPLSRTQSIHLEGASARTSPCAGEGSAMRLPRRRTRRMRQAPRPVQRPQHHRRPLAARTRRAHRSRTGPKRPGTHARPVQALPRQQDGKDETFRLQRPKPSLIHLICCTHAVRRAKPTTSGARRKRETKRKTKAIKSFSIRFAARREAERAALENVGKSTKTNQRNTHGGTP